MNKKLLAVSVAAAALVSSAAAAQPFSGPYAGVTVSADNYEVKADNLFASGDQFDGLSGNGAGFGAFAGYDFAISDRMFAGIEGSIDTSGAEITIDDGVDELTVSAGLTYELGGRLGMMVNDSTAIYGRAAWIRSEFEADLSGTSEEDDQDGWRFGAGVETALSDTIDLRLEYAFTSYDSDDTVLDVTNSQVRAGLRWKF